ncbi:zinc finger protein [Corchorus capsularis]|uniref:Zinc finger protein n=1 Tax=Corchorus capsularis TaxID=210143 RepID=A0A1R3IZQ3_COCAP|nr:zinc finger protein [Corchorus capsularis]
MEVVPHALVVEEETCTHKVVEEETCTHKAVVEKEKVVEETCTHKVVEVMSIYKHLQTLNLHCWQQLQWPKPLSFGAKTDP